MLDLITTLFSGLVSLSLVFGILAFIYKRHAEEWQMLASVYPGVDRIPQARKRFGQLVLYTEGAPARTYKGVLSIEIYSDGVGLSPFRFLVPFHDRVFIPYKDIKGWSQDWYIDGKSVELAFTRAPGMHMIMPVSQLDWIKQESGRTFNVSSQKPPHGNWPWATHAAAMACGAMALSVIVLGAAKHYGFMFA